MAEATPPHMQDAAVSLVNGKQTDTGGNLRRIHPAAPDAVSSTF